MPGEHDEMHLCFLITLELFKVEEGVEWVENIFRSIFRSGALAVEQTGGASICLRWAAGWAVSVQSFTLNQHAKSDGFFTTYAFTPAMPNAQISFTAIMCYMFTWYVYIDRLCLQYFNISQCTVHLCALQIDLCCEIFGSNKQLICLLFSYGFKLMCFVVKYVFRVWRSQLNKTRCVTDFLKWVIWHKKVVYEINNYSSRLNTVGY